MSTPGTVLIVDDEEHLRISAAQSCDLAGLPCVTLADGEEALDRLGRTFSGVLVTDIRMPGMDGITLMRRALEIDPELPVILITGHGDVNLAVSCIKEGAYDFLEKPCEPAHLIACIRRALDKRSLTLENRDLRRQVGSSDAIEARLIGRSAPMVALRKVVRAVAATDADVLITGDTGTGKEVVARALHRGSERAKGPFVHINCAALPEALTESELFGHEAGAFAGAVRARYGKLEHARGGVVCLDEIDSLPLALQAKLLDALHNRTVTRLGSNDAIALDIRVLALSKSNLKDEVDAGRFRADLLYRLNVATLQLPTLAERREDIPRLFSVLVAQAAARYKAAEPEIPPDVLHALASRAWPGNVRELRNIADRFVLGLDLDIGLAQASADVTLATQIADHEKAIIAATIAAHGGRLKETYEALGLSRKTLYEKMKRHGLDREDFADGA
ncbi:MAG: sigma-54 dependent transcriptional regulator [Pseudomonadota bacterium]